MDHIAHNPNILHEEEMIAKAEVAPHDAWAFEMNSESLGEIRKGLDLVAVLKGPNGEDYAVARSSAHKELLVAEIIKTGDKISDMKLDKGSLIDMDDFEGNNVMTKVPGTQVARFGSRVWVENLDDMSPATLMTRNPIKIGGLTEEGVVFAPGIFAGGSGEQEVVSTQQENILPESISEEPIAPEESPAPENIEQEIDPSDYDTLHDYLEAKYPKEHEEYWTRVLDPDDPLSDIIRPSPYYDPESGMQIKPSDEQEYRMASAGRERRPENLKAAQRLVKSMIERNPHEGIGLIAEQNNISPEDFPDALRNNPEIRKKVREYLRTTMSDLAGERESKKDLRKIEKPTGAQELIDLLPDRVYFDSDLKQDSGSLAKKKPRDMAVEYAIRMLNGKWDYGRETELADEQDMDYYADSSGYKYRKPKIDQHRFAARMLLSRWV